MDKKEEYVITCKLTCKASTLVLAYDKGSGGYFWTEKENIEALREQNIPPHKFIFDNFDRAYSIMCHIACDVHECAVVPLSLIIDEFDYTIIHRMKPDVYDILDKNGKIIFSRNHPDNVFFFISTHKGKYNFRDEWTEKVLNG